MHVEFPQLQMFADGSAGISWWPPEIFVNNIGRLANAPTLVAEIKKKLQATLDADPDSIEYVRFSLSPRGLWLCIDGSTNRTVSVEGQICGTHNVKHISDALALYIFLNIVASEVVNMANAEPSGELPVPISQDELAFEIKRTPTAYPWRLWGVMDDVFGEPEAVIFARTPEEARKLTSENNRLRLFRLYTKPQAFSVKSE